MEKDEYVNWYKVLWRILWLKSVGRLNVKGNPQGKRREGGGFLIGFLDNISRYFYNHGLDTFHYNDWERKKEGRKVN